MVHPTIVREPPRDRSRSVLIWVLLLQLPFCAVLYTADLDAADVDAADVAPVPRSTVVTEVAAEGYLPVDFILGPVEKIRRDVVIKDKRRVNALVRRVTYRLPEEMSIGDVDAFYSGTLGDTVLFRCRGKDCGGSNYWANNVFGVAILYGPDGNQFYAASQLGPQQLVMVYAIRRGNKRKYAHVVTLTTDAPVVMEQNLGLLARLSGNGFAEVDGVRPDGIGDFDADAKEALAQVGAGLVTLFGDVYVVCHLYGSSGTSELLDSATRCATTAAEQLQGESGPTFVPFGAGPLLPRGGTAKARVELVIPRRLHHRR